MQQKQQCPRPSRGPAISPAPSQSPPPHPPAVPPLPLTPVAGNRSAAAPPPAARLVGRSDAAHVFLYHITLYSTLTLMSVHILSSTSAHSRPLPAAPHRPAHAPGSLSRIPYTPRRALRLGTFNVGLGFLRKLPHILTRCAALALDVVARSRRSATPPPARPPPPSARLRGGPSHHEAGVGLLLSQELAPRICCYKRSSSGRLIGAVLELSPRPAYSAGLRLHAQRPRPPLGRLSQHELAHKLYDELLRWSLDAQQVIVMGDLNETLTPLDRLSRRSRCWPPSPAGRSCRPSAASRSKASLTSFVTCIRSVRASPTASRVRVPCRAGWTTSGAKATALRPCCASASTQRCTRTRTTVCCGWSSAWPILPHRTAPPHYCACACPTSALPPTSTKTLLLPSYSDACSAITASWKSSQPATTQLRSACLPRASPRSQRAAAFAILPHYRRCPIQEQRHASASAPASRALQSAAPRVQYCPTRRSERATCTVTASPDALRGIGSTSTACSGIQLRWRCDAWYGGDPHA